MNNHISQKGFANIVLIVLVVLLAGTTGYFILNNRSTSPTPPVGEQLTPTPSQPTNNNDLTPTKPISNDNPSVINGTSTSWQFINADSFSLSLPTGWKFNDLQGIDSYVGEFVGDGTKLRFDFGRYSNPLAEDNDPNHVVTYETIDGYKAKIVVPKVTDNGTTGVYFGNLGTQNRFNLYGNNLTASQQQTVLKIFRTIKFKK